MGWAKEPPASVVCVLRTLKREGPSSFILHPSLTLPGKLAGLTYRPSRECVANQIMDTLRGRVR
jgi:hypothetical protein